MHALAEEVGREERVRQSKAAVIQRILHFKALPESVNDLENYIPIGKAVKKLKSWKKQEQKLFI